MKILVVDDSGVEQARIKAILEKLGHEVQLAANGGEALEAYAVAQPDIVLLDVIMPVMGGLEAARRIRALPVPWTPIVFISGNTEPEDVATGIMSGGDDYIHKPINSVVLAAKLLAMERIIKMKSLIGRVGESDIREDIADVAGLDVDVPLASHQAGQRTLAREFSRCSRSMQPLSLVAVGIDQFERLVGECGRPTAAACLKKLAIALRSNASRMADFVSRAADNAFYVVMPDTPMTGALRVAERVRRTVLELEHTDGATHFNVSAGVATAIPRKGSDSAYLYQAAISGQQRAAIDGGNRVEALAADVPFYLTSRELECLQWSAIGKSSREIAVILTVSESAVNFHMANVRSKFDVSSRRQAVAQAIRYGLIRPA
jgi:diguanylate cyclase (GGDEF)-like protein